MIEKTPLLSQERLPRAWKLFQWTIGGTIDKRKLALSKYRGQREVLEVGCSIGNIAVAFRNIPGVSYCGLDIDAGAIRCARRDFARYRNFTFVCEDLAKHGATSGKRYDFILLAGVAHHVDDPTLVAMLEAARDLLSPAGSLVVIDPVTPQPADGRLVHWYQRLERGNFVRSFSELGKLIRGIRGLLSLAAEESMVGATPLSVPVVSRFGVFSAALAPPLPQS
jgi:SAM-dependent methyltransferase